MSISVDRRAWARAGIGDTCLEGGAEGPPAWSRERFRQELLAEAGVFLSDSRAASPAEIAEARTDLGGRVGFTDREVGWALAAARRIVEIEEDQEGIVWWLRNHERRLGALEAADAPAEDSNFE